MKIEISPLKIIFFVLLLFGIYLLINRMLGHSATLEIIVTILTGSMFAAILDLYNSNSPLGAYPRLKRRGFAAPRPEGRVGGMENCLHPTR